MFIFRALRRFLGCCQDEEEQDYYYRNNRDCTSFTHPILRDRQSPQDHSYRYESRTLANACSIGHSRENLSCPSFSSSVIRAAPSSSKQTFAPASSAGNVSVAGLSVDPEKFQIKKNPATCPAERPNAVSEQPKFPSSHISSSTAPAPLSQKPSPGLVSATSNSDTRIALSIDPEMLKFIKGFGTAPLLSNASSPSTLSSTAPNPSSKQQILAVGSEKQQFSLERPCVATLSSKCDSLPISPTTDSITPAPNSISASSKRPSLISVSSTNGSISKAPVSVWQRKLPITPDSTTKLADNPFSSSQPLLNSRKDATSPAPPSVPPTVHVSTAINSFSSQKYKPTSTDRSRESMQNLPAFAPALIKVVSRDSCSQTSNWRVLPKYEIPYYLEVMFKNDIVPPVLKQPLSPSTYNDFFATLLYAEDFYVEKWNKYLLEGIKLELRPRINSKNSSMKRMNTILVERDFVAFEIDSVPERRPYLLSRDFVFLKPLNEIAGPFKGIFFRVVKSTTALVEFGEDFHSQHSPSKRYDVSFSFNRVCLKRAHQAISVATDPSFYNILFPGQIVSCHSNTFHVLHGNVVKFQDHVRKILNHKGPIPYLVNGQPVKRSLHDQTELIIQAAMLNIFKTNPRCRILVCAPTNKTSDVLSRSLKKEIPESSLFRANAAYRDYDLVPDDILPSSLYEEDDECFACPPLAELLNFNIITCTFMSSYRLHVAGIDSEHFTHIFLVDASFATEPEAIVPLANLANKNTVIVVTGCSKISPWAVRADIARKYGLNVSYFERLAMMEPYQGNDSMFISHLA